MKTTNTMFGSNSSNIIWTRPIKDGYEVKHIFGNVVRRTEIYTDATIVSKVVES